MVVCRLFRLCFIDVDKSFFHIIERGTESQIRISGGRAIFQKTEDLIKKYASCPVIRKEYELHGEKIIVIGHFVGEKSLSDLVAELAVRRADRETEL